MSEDEPEDAPIEIPITGDLDLHAFAPRDMVNAALDYLEACAERGLTEVRLVHGRGKGVQRAALRRMLLSHPAVERFRDADAGAGGWGATIVDLHPSPTPRKTGS